MGYIAVKYYFALASKEKQFCPDHFFVILHLPATSNSASLAVNSFHFTVTTHSTLLLWAQYCFPAPQFFFPEKPIEKRIKYNFDYCFICGEIEPVL